MSNIKIDKSVMYSVAELLFDSDIDYTKLSHLEIARLYLQQQQQQVKKEQEQLEKRR
jgi:hypothetical protein